MNTLFILGLGMLNLANAREIKIGQLAPLFETKTHTGDTFNLADRKGKWTVLYFYPKAETPGCTKQACAFRDSIKVLRDLNAEVFGISADNVKEQADFAKHHSLNFTLLADPDLKVIDLYGTKMPLLKMSKRWTFVISPDLKIALVDKDVDPVKDPEKMANFIKSQKGN